MRGVDGGALGYKCDGRDTQAADGVPRGVLAACAPAGRGWRGRVATGIAAAGLHLLANDRRGLEQLCRYGARGAIALSRLSELPDGRYAYRMKRPLPDGRTQLVLTGEELLKKLAPLIPPPRQHLLRFHGEFAPNSKLRSQVVPKPPAPLVEEGAPPDKPRPRPPSPYRLDWAAAFKRVFGTDVLTCARCGGRLVVLAFIEKLSAVRTILDHLGLPSTPLPLEKARGPPQAAWDFSPGRSPRWVGSRRCSRGSSWTGRVDRTRQGFSEAARVLRVRAQREAGRRAGPERAVVRLIP
ncbi:MAG: transposase [Deltaproteobacteria bacterium]|nr:transposase [Deltaproteobacteria bacterium]